MQSVTLDDRVTRRIPASRMALYLNKTVRLVGKVVHVRIQVLLCIITVLTHSKIGRDSFSMTSSDGIVVNVECGEVCARYPRRSAFKCLSRIYVLLTVLSSRLWVKSKTFLRWRWSSYSIWAGISVGTLSYPGLVNAA